MKILFFSYAYPNPPNPGLGTFNRTMIAGLAKEHEVRVVSPVPFTDVWTAWSKGRLPQGLNGSSFQAVQDVPAVYCTWYYTPKLFRNRYGQFMRRSVGATLNRTMKEFQPDVVLSYWTHPDGEVAVTAAHQFGVRAVTMVGGSDILINARHGSRRNSILNVLHKADGVVAVSDDIKQVLIADGISAKKLYVARRGIDDRLFHDGDSTEARRNLGLPDDRPILISVGRLVDVKGHRYLIGACRLLAERGVPFRCYLLGDGPLMPNIQRQIEQLGLSEQIELKGSQSPVQLAQWYRAADLSVLASLSEGVPNVLLESIACGTPFVASNVGGIAEIADPSKDRLVPAANPGALADAIQERLTTVHSDSGNLRRFRPPTMSQSAENLLCILQTVQKGSRTFVTEEAMMHETMIDRDVTKDHSQVSTSDSPDDANMINDSKPDDFNDSDDELLGRTGENFYLKTPIVAPPTATNQDHGGSNEQVVATTNIATHPYEVRPDEDDHCGRTAEGFYYRS